MFDELLLANRRYAEDFDLAGLSGQATKGLALVTCIDTRIEPLATLGLRPGDAKILRNAGGRVTDDVLRSLPSVRSLYERGGCMDRVIPSSNANERQMLEAWIDFHRATLSMKCEGLASEDLRRRAAEPSTLSLLGLVRHLAEVERSWFRHTFLGEDAPPIWYTAEGLGSEFEVADADVDESFARWLEECEHSREVVARAKSLDVVSKRQPYGKPITLRWIMTHMIEEYARHNGHADLLRERIDGATGV